MPAKNTRKVYINNCYYHIYNRGVEKRDIFIDQQDYNVFVSYLRDYLLPKNEKQLSLKLTDPSISYKEKARLTQQLRLNNFSLDIVIYAYCLMPNHFHFLLQQNNAGAIDRFMNSLGSRYTIYFNRKYKRVGTLYEGVYKAVLVENDSQFVHLSRYIHKQALTPKIQPSSYPDYIGRISNSWIHPEEILSHFSRTNPSLSYEAFVKEYEKPELMIELTLDEG